MRLRHAKTLITGKPGVGKTTLVQKVIERMGAIHIAGFITAEIRSGGSRTGFALKGMNGSRAILAHTNIHSRHRVARYGVDIDGFEAFLAALDLMNPDAGLIVIDEIGKMELFSQGFRRLVHDVLKTDKPMLATISLTGNAFIRDIKRRPDIHLLEVTPANRNDLVEAIVDRSQILL